MTIVDSLRTHHPDLILVDGGDWGETHGSSTKSMALLRGMQALKYDALCMGRRELESALWDSVAASAAGEKALVGNVRLAAPGAERKAPSRPLRIVERGDVKVAVISVWLEKAVPAKSFLQASAPEIFLRQQLQAAKKANVRLVTVYGNGNNADSALTALTGKFPEVDAWLLAGGPGRVMNSVSSSAGALIVGPGDRGRELALLTIEKSKEVKQRKAEFKQIILGKWVKASEAAKPIAEPPKPKPSNGNAKVSGTSATSPVTAQNRFIGDGSCKLCHEEIYEKWANTKHAHALETLVAKKEDQNKLCLPCHVTGYEQATGFGNTLDGVNLGKVSCEACHGSGEYHVTSGNRNAVLPNEALCRSCHTAEWSPKFVYEEYKNRVH
jgi:hypothetical protein